MRRLVVTLVAVGMALGGTAQADTELTYHSVMPEIPVPGMKPYVMPPCDHSTYLSDKGVKYTFCTGALTVIYVKDTDTLYNIDYRNRTYDKLDAAGRKKRGEWYRRFDLFAEQRGVNSSKHAHPLSSWVAALELTHPRGEPIGRRTFASLGCQAYRRSYPGKLVVENCTAKSLELGLGPGELAVLNGLQRAYEEMAYPPPRRVQSNPQRVFPNLVVPVETITRVGETIEQSDILTSFRHEPLSEAAFAIPAGFTENPVIPDLPKDGSATACPQGLTVSK